MATLADDFMAWDSPFFGRVAIPLHKLDLEWPPPERLYFARGGVCRAAAEGDDERFVLVRVSMSALDDETAAGMEHVARGAKYEYLNQSMRWAREVT